MFNHIYFLIIADSIFPCQFFVNSSGQCTAVQNKTPKISPSKIKKLFEANNPLQVD